MRIDSERPEARQLLGEFVSGILGRAVDVTAALSAEERAMLFHHLSRQDELRKPRQPGTRLLWVAEDLESAARERLPVPHVDEFVHSLLPRLPGAMVLSRSCWPEGRPFAICLSHDMDHVTSFIGREQWRQLRRRSNQEALSFGERLTLAGQACKTSIRGWVKRDLLGRPDRFGNVGAWLKLEADCGFKSSLFFFGETIEPWHPYDCNYSFGDRVQFEGRAIVHDGGSRDSTRDLVESYAAKYPVRFCQEQDSGIYDGVVRGMSKARGEVLAWLGADDCYLPWTLSTVHEVFARHPELDWIIGIPARGYNQNQVVKVSGLAPVYLQLLIRRGWHCGGWLGCLQQESMFWRRSLWEKSDAPSMLARYKLAGDYHLWRAFARHAPLWTVSSVLAVCATSQTQASRRYLSKSLEEIGPHARGLRASWWGKLLNRLIGALGNHRVLRPDADLARQFL